MNSSTPSRSDRGRYLVALCGGLMWALSFPTPAVAGLAWIAPGVILFSAVGRDGGAAFRLGYAAGLIHYLISLRWLLLIPFPIGAAAGWLALSAFLALYPAMWVWLCWRFLAARGQPDALRWLDAMDTYLATPLWKRCAWAIGCAVVWTALEMTVARFLSGFPWNLLGASQYRMLPLIQVAEFAGVYGVTFLVVWFSVSLASAFLALVRKPASRSIWLSELLLPGLVAVVCYTWGYHKVLRTPEPAKTLRVALIQPSIKQELIFDAKENPARFRKLMDLSRAALAEKPQLLIWPEAAMPSLDETMFRNIVALIREHRVWMIFGADDAEEGNTGVYRFFNAAFLFGPDGKFAATYRKQRLVIFGEYVPLAKWLPFLRKLTPIQGGFTPGTGPVAFRMPDLGTTTSALICFEDNFPHGVREHVTPDLDFLLNLTNNGWFGESSAQWQHAANAVFRAIENGLPLVRCTNNGLTCWVDANGGLHEVRFEDTDNIYAAGYKMANIPLLGGKPRVETFYHRRGDIFGWGCCAIALLLLSREFVEIRHVRRKAG